MSSPKQHSLETPQEQERSLLACFVQWPELVADYVDILKADFFYHRAHRAIFSSIFFCYQEYGKIDPIALCEKLKGVGVVRFEDIDIFEYITITLSEFPAKKDNVDIYVKTVIKYHVARKADKALDEAKESIRAKIHHSANEISKSVELALEEATTESLVSDEADDVWGGMVDFLKEKKLTKPVISLNTKFHYFDRWFGGIPLKQLVVFIAQYKAGKSTLLSQIANNVTETDNVKVLIIDTELDIDLVRARTLQSQSNVHERTIQRGGWNENEERDRLWNAIKKNSEKKGRIFHKYLGAAKAEDICSFAKRFYHRNIKDDEILLVIIDYIKLPTSVNPSESMKEYQIIGRAVDSFKQLSASFPNITVASAMQTNGDGHIASAKQALWFLSNAFKFERKTPDEIGKDGPRFGTHKLYPFDNCMRVQGEFYEERKTIKITDKTNKETFVEDYIFMDVQNFNVKEAGLFSEAAKNTNSDHNDLDKEEFDDRF